MTINVTTHAFHNISQIEASLWEAADQLRANSKLTSSEYCMAGVLQVIAPMDRWTEKEQTQAEVLPEPPYTPDVKQQVAALVYRHIWQQSVRGL